VKIRVYYEDTDIGGLVYHSNYLNFCERSRSELFFQKGVSPINDDGHFVVKHIDASFMKPAKFGDIIEVKNSVIQMKSASLVMRQTIYLEEITLFEMDVTLVFLKGEKITKIPSAYLTILQG
jgi:acyl-CoA thioester hydrolase